MPAGRRGRGDEFGTFPTTFPEPFSATQAVTLYFKAAMAPNAIALVPGSSSCGTGSRSRSAGCCSPSSPSHPLHHHAGSEAQRRGLRGCGVAVPARPGARALAGRTRRFRAPSALPVQEFDTPNAAAFSVITNLVTPFWLLMLVPSEKFQATVTEKVMRGNVSIIVCALVHVRATPPSPLLPIPPPSTPRDCWTLDRPASRGARARTAY